MEKLETAQLSYEQKTRLKKKIGAAVLILSLNLGAIGCKMEKPPERPETAKSTQPKPDSVDPLLLDEKPATLSQTELFGPSDFTPANHRGNLPGVWQTLRNCETGGDYKKNTGNDYYGAYQAKISTWDGAAANGRSELVGIRPDLAAPADQDDIAMRIEASGGFDSQFPGCTRKHKLSRRSADYYNCYVGGHDPEPFCSDWQEYIKSGADYPSPPVLNPKPTSGRQDGQPESPDAERPQPTSSPRPTPQSTPTPELVPPVPVG